MLLPLNSSISPHGGITYKQPETPFDIHSLSMTDVIRRVGRHRRSVPHLMLDTAEGWEDRLKSDLCLQNPRMRCEDVLPPEERPLAVEGRERWAELHGYAAAYPESPSEQDVMDALQWLASWRQRIPQHRSCKCRESFADLERKMPFDLTSRRAFWRSTVLIHDGTNFRLGKPLFADSLLDMFG